MREGAKRILFGKAFLGYLKPISWHRGATVLGPSVFCVLQQHLWSKAGIACNSGTRVFLRNSFAASGAWPGSPDINILVQTRRTGTRYNKPGWHISIDKSASGVIGLRLVDGLHRSFLTFNSHARTALDPAATGSLSHWAKTRTSCQ